MEKKLLIAVDPSVHSLHAIDYAQSFEPAGKNIKCTLFNIQPAISTFLLEEAKTSGKANVELKKIIQQNATAAHRFLSDYKERMVRKGWSAGQIDIITHPKIQGTAKDIIDYGQAGLFDAIVAGRRGITRAQEIFTGSITTNILEHSRLIPVWIVDQSVTLHRILAAVDGSKNALRVVDHLSYILAGTSNIRVTLFHVNAKPKIDAAAFPEGAGTLKKIMAASSRNYIEAFFEAARERFANFGVPEADIETKVAPSSLNIGKSISNEAKRGGYDTVVVGRSGEDRAFFMGSVSRYVIRKLSGCALWLVP